MQKKQVIKGRILYASGDILYLARGAKIFKSYDNGVIWDLWIRLPVSFLCGVVLCSPILARLFRLGIHHLTFSGDTAVVIFNKESFLIKDGRIRSLGLLEGSRPLALCANADATYYGEYRSNPERSVVHVWSLNSEVQRWQPIWTFEGVRHVHGVFADPFTDSIWVTTGDTDKESAIWQTTDGFTTLEKILGGAQQFRAVQLLFTSDFVYFGSDAPTERNYIYRWERWSKKLTTLVSVGGPVYFGYRAGDTLFFSTAVEPGAVHTSGFVEVWRSVGGEVWEKIDHFEKDRYPMKYFQYGQVFFPNGIGNENVLFFTPFATKSSHCVTFQYNL